jgi:hypothetical protein
MHVCTVPKEEKENTQYHVRNKVQYPSSFIVVWSVLKVLSEQHICRNLHVSFESAPVTCLEFNRGQV